ncbi:unnamed protein product [Rangifer tarandus platyrhynchus]|uniref:Uncharacterized protein n=2 Tax=Rangifer tarandus platyrhynchus TaxID=3082113 RepID=A0ACB0EEZ7_RANTA|nr:unnamed protein product [Rangifer tarandus platyrhynchus]CAI9699302.1 unnamed protein product [Rangifer tarandus platyrhynchus]
MGFGNSSGRGADPSSSLREHRHLPRHPPTHSKPFPPPPLPPRKVSEAPAGAAGRGGWTAAAASGWPSQPASRSADTSVAATAAAAPLAPCSPPPLSRQLSPAGSPPRELLSLCLSFPLPPLLHSRNASRSVAPFHHIRIREASNSWLSAPRLGAVRPGLGLPVPRAGSVWVRRPKLDRAGAGRGGVGVSSRGKEAVGYSLAARVPPTQRVTPSLSPPLPQTH